MTRSPSYLYQNQYGYCFRMRVPYDLQSCVGKKELKRSLQTGYVSLARTKAMLMGGRYQQLFRWIRKQVPMAKLTEQEIQDVVGRFVAFADDSDIWDEGNCGDSKSISPEDLRDKINKAGDAAAEYDHVASTYGIWSHRSVWFSKYGNLVETAKDLIDTSSAGYTAKELENIVHVETKHALLNLFKNRRADRERIGSVLVYFSAEKTVNNRQRLNRQQLSEQIHFDLSCEIDTQSHELKAAIILFYSLLNEKQRRLFAGLESFKIGHGGDKRIADLLGLDIHTVAKGRREIFSGSVQFEGVRKKGSGRKPVEKKFRRSSKESND